MNIFYKHKDIELVCLSDREAKKLYGADIAKKLRLRLVQLVAYQCLADVGTRFRLHELDHDRDGQLAVDITDRVRLVFQPANHPVPQKADGGLDRAKVTAITIIEVVNYHG